MGMFHLDAKIQCDKNTEFYLQHENEQIEWLILIRSESSNCIKKGAFWSVRNIEGTEWRWGEDALDGRIQEFLKGGVVHSWRNLHHQWCWRRVKVNLNQVIIIYWVLILTSWFPNIEGPMKA